MHTLCDLYNTNYTVKPLFWGDKTLEIHGCVLKAVAADVLVLKHQVISIHSTD